MTKHPSAAMAAERRQPRPAGTDESLQQVQEMIDLVALSSFGTPAARRLRAMADPGVIDGLVEDHMRRIPHPVPDPIPDPSPPTTRARTTGGSGGMDTEWMARGNCANESPRTFLPSDGVGVEVARRICASCPVREPCLEYALANRIDHGVWGGTSERERRRILKQRRRASLTVWAAQSDAR